jgi:heme/copper-type cytochrome/quinol oxidase subunit 3
MMTGLHGVHVLIGMALIYWILLRTNSPHVRGSLLAVAPLMLALYLLWLGSITHGHLAIPGWRTFDNGMWWLAGLVVLLGVAMLVRAASQARVAARRPGDFGPMYFTPVDLVGLYWHLVDLIWIFLFPLLYLIH